MIIDIFGIAIVCCLIDQTSKISVIFMAVSIGILCALYEINIRRKLKIKKTQLLLFEVICVLGYSLSLLGENYSIYFLLSALGIVGVLISYNIKMMNFRTSMILLFVSVVCAIVPFILVLNWLRAVIFAISFIIVTFTLYYKQHEGVMV